ncbi:MAG: Peptide methionine sulfoxide reductase MsrA [Nitrosopumilales archaeon]|nr:MAG: Peptide methionine sulfoxide reductase MsrA [Nitrosopumilales archaeon]
MVGIIPPEWYAFNLIKTSNDFMKATFAAGCFWHVEDLFRKVKGVSSATSGYTGGTMPSPSYQDVCTDRTGHAEAVQVEYDPEQVSYDDLLKVFWKNHNPTTLNQQGPDVGTQYRSAVFYHDVEQEKAAKEYMKKLQDSMPEKKVVTEITPAKEFFKAEEYHQRYFEKQGLI